LRSLRPKAGPTEYCLLTGEPSAGDCLPFAFQQVFLRCILYSPTAFVPMTCPEYFVDVRQLLGAYFDTMFADIQMASSPGDRATALSQFIREFGQVQGDPRDENPRMCAPAVILIPPGSLIARDHGRKHDLHGCIIPFSPSFTCPRMLRSEASR
jgi:hypothetical protein